MGRGLRPESGSSTHTAAGSTRATRGHEGVIPAPGLAPRGCERQGSRVAGFQGSPGIPVCPGIPWEAWRWEYTVQPLSRCPVLTTWSQFRGAGAPRPRVPTARGRLTESKGPQTHQSWKHP